MIGELVGGLTSVAWLDLQARYQYGFGSPYAGLAAGKGLAHPGVLNVGPIKLGTWAGRAIQGKAKQGWRAGAGKFLGGGTFFEESLGFDAALLKQYEGRSLASIIGRSSSAPHLLLEDMVRHARFVRGAALGLRALSVASIVAVTAPLAYSAGRGLVNAAKAIRGPIGMSNTLDWGGRLASAFMTGQAATERQRSIQALEMARTMGRSYLGQEARYVHQ